MPLNREAPKHLTVDAPMLTEKAVLQAKPREKTYRLFDGQYGLYLEVAPSGGKWWRMKYRRDGKETRISLGVYPLVTLKEAREKAFEFRRDMGKGIDPSSVKRTAKREQESIFEVVALAWWDKFMRPNGGKYPMEVKRRLERELFPHIGHMPLAEIDAPTILKILRRVEARGTIETAHKIKSFVSQIMRYGIACGLILHDPARDLSGAIAPRRKKHRPAIIDPKGVGALMRAIDGYPRAIVRCALKLAALTFLRPGELRKGLWEEVDIEAADWRIPAERMKMKRAHIVPLSRQAIAVLRELSLYTGPKGFLFPSTRSLEKPMSDMAVNMALRLMGYGETMSGHGFRAMANSLLAEKGWSVDAIERQLAHVETNQVRAAYHRAQHLDERRRMMQAWADYLSELKDSV